MDDRMSEWLRVPEVREAIHRRPTDTEPLIAAALKLGETIEGKRQAVYAIASPSFIRGLEVVKKFQGRNWRRIKRELRKAM